MIFQGVARQGRPGWWTGGNGGVEQLKLQVVEFAFQVHDVQLLVLSLEKRLDVVGDRRMCQDPMIRSFRDVIAASEATARADFLDEFHHWLEEVGVES